MLLGAAMNYLATSLTLAGPFVLGDFTLKFLLTTFGYIRTSESYNFEREMHYKPHSSLPCPESNPRPMSKRHLPLRYCSGGNAKHEK